MTLNNLVQECLKLNVLLLVDEQGLLCRAPQGVLTPEFLAQITQHKPQLLALLTETSPAALPWECGCLWDSACLPPPTQCIRCGQHALCPDCYRCRYCWLARILQRVKVPPPDER
jgi:hypothetical protein